MKARPRSSFPIGLTAITAAALGACSSSTTTLALTVASGSDIVSVAKLHVTVAPAAGDNFVFDFTPPLVDGAIRSSFFQRITLPGGLDGPATITVEARDTAGATTASGQTATTIVKNGAFAASVTLMPGGLPPPGDGGADATDAIHDVGSADAGDGGSALDASSDSGG